MIIFDDILKWSEEDIEIVLLAKRIIGTRLGKFTKACAETTFDLIIGDIHFSYGDPHTPDGSIVDAYTEASGAHIIVRRGHVKLQLLLHEFMHVFDIHCGEIPHKMLVASTLDNYLIRETAFENGLDWLGSHRKAKTAQEWFANLAESVLTDHVADNLQGQAMLKWWDEYFPTWIKNCVPYKEEIDERI